MDRQSHLGGRRPRWIGERATSPERLTLRFTVFNYDRRGHGDSGDTQPYAIEPEVEDLEAVIDEAGGSTSVFASSGNGIFAPEAAACGFATKIEKLAVWEPPYIVDDSHPPPTGTVVNPQEHELWLPK